MKIKFYFWGLLSLSSFAFGQTGNVGINTETPSATLDVNGNVKIRTAPTGANISDFTVLGVNNTTKEVTQLNSTIFASASTTTNGTVTKVKATGTRATLGLTLGTGWEKVNFPAAEIGGSTHFNATTDAYTVPSDGLYAVKYRYRVGSGVALTLLSVAGFPAIGVNKNGVQLEQTVFSGANVGLSVVGLFNLGLLSVILSEAWIDSVYQFTAGDQLTFHANQGGLSLSILTDNIAASVIVYKISN